MPRVMEIRSAHRKEVSVTDQPDLWKEGQGILLECDGEKWLAEIVMTSKNGVSLMMARSTAT